MSVGCNFQAWFFFVNRQGLFCWRIMILFGQIVKIQARPLRGYGLFYSSAFTSKLVRLRNKKARLLSERAFIHMLPDKDSNQDSSDSTSDMLPVTLSGNVTANV